MSKKAKLIEEILQVCKASDTPMTGDLFFGLAFRTESELIEIARNLNVKI